MKIMAQEMTFSSIPNYPFQLGKRCLHLLVCMVLTCNVTHRRSEAMRIISRSCMFRAVYLEFECIVSEIHIVVEFSFSGEILKRVYGLFKTTTVVFLSD